MVTNTLNSEDIAKRALELYDRGIRAKVEPEHKGKFLVIDIDTGAYEVDADELAAARRARAKNPLGARFLMRVGYPAAYRLGGRFVPASRT